MVRPWPFHATGNQLVGDVVSWARHKMGTAAFDNYLHWKQTPWIAPNDGF